MTDPISRIAGALGDRYELEKEIGSGGFARVFLGRDKKLQRSVAIKALRSDVADAIAADRFLKEIEIAARLNHPNILPLFDSGQSDGVLYYVMPYVEGESLRMRLDREGQLPIEESVRIAREVAEALEHAHANGVVHRDIKPENILLSEGHALVSDFGVARAVSTSATPALTQSGFSVGTPTYMSPEQVTGTESADGRSDLYALGCVLFEMLGGEPPFQGKTQQSILARHLSEKPPPASALRATVPRRLDKAISKLLAKSPADRYARAADLHAVLADPKLLAEETPPRFNPRKVLWGTGALLCLAAIAFATAVGVKAWMDSRPPPLTPNKVLVFPLGDRTGNGFDGARAGLAVVQALEHADPIRPLDGWDELDPVFRDDIDLLPPGDAREMAAEVGAGRYLTGSTTRMGDSTGVTLTLFDTGPDTLLAQETTFGPNGSSVASDLTLQAVKELLPKLVVPGREVDLSAIMDRDHSAITLWLNGEEEYRHSHFTEALDFFNRAIAEDSLMAMAALNGAQAASWSDREDDATRLIQVALVADSLLPPRHREFAHGLNAYLVGDAAEAISHLKSALEEDPEWAEVWMALAEVYYHLLPSDLVVDSSARASFDSARVLSPEYTPPLIHLVEYSLREGRLGDAGDILELLHSADPKFPFQAQHRLMLECLRGGPERTDWKRGSIQPDLLSITEVGKTLSGGGAELGCAEAAFRQVLLAEDPSRAYHWGAFLGLQGILSAQGRFEELTALVDSATSTLDASAMLFHPINDLAGAPMKQSTAEVDAFLTRTFGDTYEGTRPQTAWVMGVWHAIRGDAGRAEGVARNLRASAEEGGEPVAGVLAESIEAHLAARRGDTLGAVRQLRALHPISPRGDLAYGFAEPLPVVRIELARLLLSQGNFEEAHRLASGFDHPQPIIFLPFIPESLVLRIRAAEGMSRPDLVSNYRERLQMLGRPDLIGPLP